MSSKPIDKILYEKVKKLANKKFESKSGIYRSSWIVREYKKLGGKYKGPKPKKSGLTRWYKEEWVDLNRPILRTRSSKSKLRYESCGRKTSKIKGRYPLCRPTKRVTFKTPKTLDQLDKKSINKAKQQKEKIKATGNLSKFGGKPQFYGKKSDVMITIPQNVKKVAVYSFKLKEMGFEGGRETGWKRAKQLATKESISIQDLKYMRAWFARHLYASYPTYKKWQKAGRPKTSEWYNKHGIISWLIWGGDAAFNWVNSKKNINLLNEYFDKDYKPTKLN